MTVSLQQVKSRFSEYQIPPPLKGLSSGAFEAFEKLGFPDRKNENWKYTNINALLAKDLQFVPAADSQKVASGSGFHFKNGHLVSAPQMDGVLWKSLGAGSLGEGDLSEFPLASQLADGFEALAVSAPSEILYIDIPANTVVAEKITLDFDFQSGNEETLYQPLVYVRIGKGSEAHFLEAINGNGREMVNVRMQMQLADGARAHHVKLVHATESHRNVASLEVFQGRDSFFQSSCFTSGGKVLRHSVTVHQQESGAESVCNGLYLTKDKEHTDFRVNMRHLKPHGTSRQLYKGVLKDSSRAVFNGKIYIEKDAQKTDSSQLNNNLVLSRKAEADSKPELEVYADDVKANHGSAIGQLDQDQLFYLMSRAISREEAVKILARGFVEEVVLKVESPALREESLKWLEASLVNFQQSLEQSRGFAQ